jgi:quercetin dioxygenase-like cupin family protein
MVNWPIDTPRSRLDTSQAIASRGGGFIVYLPPLLKGSWIGMIRPKEEDAMDVGTQPYALASEEGQAVWFLGTLVIMKATGEQTGGAFGLIDNLMPAGFASPYHMHRNEDESFYVVEGEMTFYLGEERVKAEAGAFVYGPRGVPHGFEVDGPEPARILLQNYPAGFEGFPVEVGEPAKELSIPPAEPPDMDKLMALAAKYDIEILGPLPGH